MTKSMSEGFNTETDAAYDKLKANQEMSGKAKKVLAGAGYARGGGVSPVKAVHKHEGNLHKGEKKTAFKHGGKIDGHKTKSRADKYTRGGSVPKGHHTKVEINMGASQADKQDAMKKGVVMGAQLAAAKMGGGPRPGAGAPMQARGPMPGAPAPMAPGSMPTGGVPPTMQKNGGRTYKSGGKVGPVRVPGVPHMDGGGGGGAGRREKIRQYGTKPKK